MNMKCLKYQELIDLKIYDSYYIEDLFIDIINNYNIMLGHYLMQSRQISIFLNIALYKYVCIITIYVTNIAYTARESRSMSVSFNDIISCLYCHLLVI